MSRRPQAHPDDLLLVGYLYERQGWPEFDSRQIVSTNYVSAFLGRRFRRLYITDLAMPTITPTLWETINSSSAMSKPGYGELCAASTFRPHVPPSKLQHLAELVKGLVL